MTSRQLLTLESLSHQSLQPPLSRPSSQLDPCPSPDCVVDIECSQVDSIARALNTAKVLGRVRRGRLAQSEPPRDRQILERTLKNNLERRLSQISLTGPPRANPHVCGLIQSSQIILPPANILQEPHHHSIPPMFLHLGLL